jgi:hypothetical protein
VRSAHGNSFDHLVGAAEQRERDRKAERLGGLEVDVQLDFGGLLDQPKPSFDGWFFGFSRNRNYRAGQG